ncbi:DNA-binding transcription factor yap1 [Coemansia sp. RSA 552]|nr:DNA-binding transcription factor yap1 [Coemansia sp. RSA 552]
MSAADVAHTDLTPQKRATSAGLSDESPDEKKARKPGRKMILTEASSKRTAQNRAAQRAFRERKQHYLKGLEEKVRELTEQQERTERENDQLKQCVQTLQKENKHLRNGKFTYESAPVDFERTMTELFESSTAPPSSGLDLSSAFDLQQAAMSGADLTLPGAMDRIRPAANTSSSGASPQSVPVIHPASVGTATASTMASGLMQQSPSTILGTTASPSLTSAFSSDIMNGIELLAANQNISTGTFMNQLFDGTTTGGVSGASLATMVPGFTTSRSPSTSTNAAVTPSGDMFVPLNNITPGGSGNGGLYSADSGFRGQSDASFAALVRQINDSNASQGQKTPSLNELLSLSPSQTADSLLGMGSPTEALGDLAAAAAVAYPPMSLVDGGMSSAYLNGADTSQDRSLALASYLQAYRNPDPVGMGDDGDQLEKLLLNSMFPSQAQDPPGGSAAVADPAAMLTSEPITTQAAQPAAAVAAGGPQQASPSPPSSAPQCTCRECDEQVCDPCPVHGSPGDLSEELREMAPQMLGTVCTKTNRLADDELNDLCSLMFKYAKCTEVQKRVEQVREKLKMDSELELLQTKQKLAKQYGIQ